MGVRAEQCNAVAQSSGYAGSRIFFVTIGLPTELRLEIETHWPICGACPPPTAT